MIDGIHTLNVLVEVAEERHAQDERWGEQNHPVHDHSDPTGIYLLGRRYADFERLAKLAFSRGARSWALIELEELFEALAAPTPKLAREEFIQVAAVAVAAVEALDRDEAKKHSPDCELGMWHGGKCGPSAVLAAINQETVRRAMEADTVPATFSRITKETVEHTIKELMGPGAGLALKLEPIPFLRDVPAVTSIRHAYNGAGRLHGICRCGEARDFWAHQCPDCSHGFHTQVCMEITGKGPGESVTSCGCRS